MDNTVKLMEIIKSKKLCIDSTVALCPEFMIFLRDCEKIYSEKHKWFFIPCFEYDIIKQASISGNSSQNYAIMAINAIDALAKSGIIKKLGEQQSGVATTYEEFFSKCSVMKPFTFIVQSSNKKNVILDAARKAGIYHSQIEMLKLEEDGKLGFYPRYNQQPSYSSNQSKERSNVQYSSPRVDDDAFRIITQLQRMTVKQIRPLHQNGEGTVLFTRNGERVRIGKKRLINTDSSTYETDRQSVWAKLYKPERLSTYYQKKADLMLSKPINFEGINWPKEELFDEGNNFIGILIDEAKGYPLHLSVFKQAGLQEYFPNWTKADLCILAITILTKISYLHRRNVLLGCINPASIFVESPKEVYFTDTDCYQVESFPCFIHNVNFTAPELQKQNNSVYLVSKQQEYFGVAVMAFMLMMPGKPPYVGKHPGDASEEIVEMKFPYSNRQIRGTSVPPGVWRFVWSHLTPFKDPFYNTFQKGGFFSLPGKRRNPEFWINLLNDFYKELTDKNIYDKESLKIFPSTFRRSNNVQFVRCKYCGIEHPRFFFRDEYFETNCICNSCLSKKSNIYYKCESCGRVFYYTNKAAIFHQRKEASGEWKKQKYCKDCKSRTATCSKCGKILPTYSMRGGMCFDCYNNTIYTSIRCKSCGSVFSITNGQYEFFVKKGMSLPVRCERCRKQAKRY